MKSVFTVTESDLYEALIDTRYDLRVVGITDPEKAGAYLKKLYGREIPVCGGEAYAEGSDSLFKPRYSDGNGIPKGTRTGSCPSSDRPR